MIYATYGAVEFQLGVIDTLSVRAGMSYAEHALIDSKPRLQCTGSKLLDLPIRAFLDIEFCTPRTAADALRTAMESKAANAFVLANGTVLGDFVITDYSETVERTADDGTPLTLVLDLSLKEFVPGAPAKAGGAALIGLGGVVPANLSALALPAGLAGGLSGMRQALGQAATLGRQIAGGVGAVRNTLAQVRNLRNLPAAAKALAGCAGPLLRTASQSTALAGVLAPVRAQLDVADRVWRQATATSADARAAAAVMTTTVPSNLPATLASADLRTARMSGAWRELGGDLAKLAARGGVRGLQ